MKAYKHIGFLLFLVVGLNFCIAQTDIKKGIIGTWELVHKVSDLDDNDEEELSISEPKQQKSDPFMNQDVLCTFKSDGGIIFLIQDFSLEASYTLKNSDLSIGNRQYTIEKVQKDSLFFKDKNGVLNIKYIYKRIKNDEK